MSIEWFLYLSDILPCLGIILGVGALISFIIIAIGFMGTCDDEESTIGYINFIKKYIWIPFLAILISILLPSQKTMYLIMGANALKKSDIPSKVERVIDKKLDEFLVEKK